MTTGEALLAAVWAAPDDDLPRLVFADHLDEQGEHERAEFVRLQIHTARHGTRPGWTDRLAELLRAPTALLVANVLGLMWSASGETVRPTPRPTPAPIPAAHLRERIRPTRL